MKRYAIKSAAMHHGAFAPLYFFYQTKGLPAPRSKTARSACLDHIANVMLPDAEKIVLVMDNLNTHNTASLYETFYPEKARIKLKTLYPAI